MCALTATGSVPEPGEGEQSAWFASESGSVPYSK